MNVPAVDFSSLNLVAPMTQYGTSGGGPDAGYSYMYGGPSLAVQRITDSVAAQGSIATVATTPAVNSSWEIDFEGPSLHCNPVSSDFRRNALDNILNYTLGRSRGPGGDNCNYGPGYVAWHPSSMSLNDSVRELLPFYISTSTRNESTYTLNNAEGYSYPYTDLASLFLAVTPTLMEKTRADGWTPPRMCRGNSWYDAALADYHEVSTVLRCDVHNSTYHAAFSFVNGVQSIEVDATEVTRTPMTVLTDALAYFGTTNGSSQGSQPRACPDSGITPDGVFADACVLDPTVMSTLSYQAVMHAFSSLLTGSISIGDREDLITAVTSTTRLSSTVLARSPELAFLQDGMSQSLGAIQQTAPSFQAPFAGLVNGAVTQKSALPLQQALEQVFQNITFSLMSAAELQYVAFVPASKIELSR